MAKRSDKTRTLVTPTLVDLGVDGGFVATGESKLEFWKQILPEDKINYRDESGEVRVLDFTRETNTELLQAFRDKALDQTSFLLADKDNAHTMDPERWRADVVDMRLANEGEDPGLYARLRFPSKKAAKAVIRNPNLGVSARIRENVEKARGGQTFKRAIIHVLGTLDPKVTGMSGWTPAVDLSEYAAGDVLDLSGTTYAEASVSKNKTKTQVIEAPRNAQGEIELPAYDEVDPADMERWSDEYLAAFLAEYGPDDPDDDADSGDADDDDDDSDDDVADTTKDRQPVGAGADMSNTDRSAIDLANSRANEADARSRRALRLAADAQWDRDRTVLETEGVPPWVLDLSQPALAGVDDYVIDLSNHGGDKDVNMSAIVRKLVDGYKGTVDLSEREIGHGDADGEDPDATLKAQFAALDI